MVAPQNLRAIGDRIEQMLGDLAATANPRSYEQAEELLRLVTELYGAALIRVIDIAAEIDPAVVQAMVDDELVASLLVVHGLHPDGLASRVETAIASVRPFLAGHGGDVELIDVDEAAGAVFLRLMGSCDGCPSSAVTLKTAVERAILEAAPEIVIIDVEEPSVPDTSTPITLGRKPAVPYDPTTGCGATMAHAGSP